MKRIFATQTALRRKNRGDSPQLWLEQLETRWLLAVVLNPSANSLSAPADTDVVATFDQDVDSATVSATSFAVHSTQRGRLVADETTVNTNGATITVDPATDFFPGELVQVSVTPSIQSADGQNVDSQVQEFRVAVTSGSGVLSSSDVPLSLNSRDATFGDLDRDGDLDAFIAGAINQVWLNEAGQFSDSLQDAGDGGRSVALGDIDSDGDLDALIAGVSNQVWRNDGGQFSNSGQILGDHSGSFATFGDFDGDGNIDAITISLLDEITLAGVAEIWMNDGNGVFAMTQSLETTGAVQLGLGDFDSDGDLDAFVPRANLPDQLLINTDGTFTPGAQMLGLDSSAVALGDLDGDGDLDAFVAGVANHVWLNDSGAFSDSGQSLGDHLATDVTLGDLDADGDLDALVTEFSSSRVWLNESGIFTDSGQTFATTLSNAVALGDADLDGDLDALVAGFAGNQLLLNQNSVLQVASISNTSSGVVVEFSDELDASTINLYGTQAQDLGPADIVLTGASSGRVAGSLVVKSKTVEFVKSGGPLVPDDYTVVVRSGSDGIRAINGDLLDGNSDGAAGDDFTFSFSVLTPAAGAITLSLPDFVRGPGQEVNLPADSTFGIPVTVSDGGSVMTLSVRVAYDPTLLAVSAAKLGPNIPDGAEVAFLDLAPGLATLSFTTTTELPPGPQTLVQLEAVVPAGISESVLHVLELVDVALLDQDGTPVSVVSDNALHLVSYPGDVSGNGRINAADAAQVARVAALLDGGFVSSSNTDPVLVGDVSGNGRVNAADAALIARFAALLDVPQIPSIPAGPIVAESIRPVFRAPINSVPVLAVPVNADDQSCCSAATSFWPPTVDRAIVELDRSLSTDEGVRLSLEAAVQELDLSTQQMGWDLR